MIAVIVIRTEVSFLELKIYKYNALLCIHKAVIIILCSSFFILFISLHTQLYSLKCLLYHPPSFFFFSYSFSPLSSPPLLLFLILFQKAFYFELHYFNIIKGRCTTIKWDKIETVKKKTTFQVQLKGWIKIGLKWKKNTKTRSGQFLLPLCFLTSQSVHLGSFITDQVDSFNLIKLM